MAVAGKKNWLAQNWAWAVPVGVLALAAAGAALIAPFYIGTGAAIRRTGAYKEAIRRVSKNPAVREQLGEPIEAGFAVEGNLQISGRHGFADFVIPVTGPKGKGTIRVEAVLAGGTWRYQHLALQAEGSSNSIVVEGQRPELVRPTKTDDSEPEISEEGQPPEVPKENSPPADPGPPPGTPPPGTGPPGPPKAESSDTKEVSAPEASKNSP